jgi:hypothetical protein
VIAKNAGESNQVLLTMKPSVPDPLDILAVISGTKTEIPKSVNFKWPFFSIKIFAGYKINKAS